ncbi:hypothetical protein L345_15675, partial [Ophiophagus hannah]
MCVKTGRILVISEIRVGCFALSSSLYKDVFPSEILGQIQAEAARLFISLDLKTTSGSSPSSPWISFTAAGTCALMCEICTSPNSDCTGSKQECTVDDATCMTLMTEVNLGNQKMTNTAKSCTTKDACKLFEDMKGKATTQQSPNVPVGAIIKQVICSKAPSSFASFFPVVLGLLLMKLLF